MISAGFESGDETPFRMTPGPVGPGVAMRFATLPRRLMAACILMLTFAGCGESGEPVRQERIESDAARWAAAGIRDYDLVWQSVSTRNRSTYKVYVRDGSVRAVRLVRPDGKAVALKPADMNFYSVEGLFRTIREELAQSQEPRPFGQPPGTTVVLTMRSDDRLGYPTIYRRDIFGVEDRMGIDVIELTPSKAEVPPPDPVR